VGVREKDRQVQEISVNDLAEWRSKNEDFQLIDVREPYEYEIANLNGVLIPLAEIEAAVDQIASDKKVVVHCRSGVRSAQAIRQLENKYGFKNLYNLAGGILAYADEIDTTLAKY